MKLQANLEGARCAEVCAELHMPWSEACGSRGSERVSANLGTS